LAHHTLHHLPHPQDPAVTRPVKAYAIAGLVVIFAYVVSPVDIVPDFIPLGGWVDDLVVVPLGLALIRKFTPGFSIVEKRERAQAGIKRILFWTIFTFAIAILLVLIWLGFLIYLIVKLITG